MFTLSLFLALAVGPKTAAPATIPASSETLAACTAKQLQEMVTPAGIRQSWPKVSELPAEFKGQTGLPLSGPRGIGDGFRYWLFVSESTKSAYVVQTGGFKFRKYIYGPLPVADCAPARHGASVKQSR